MFGFSAYILSIVGIIFVSIVVELVMSDGPLSKHIKSIFSFFSLAVLIAPLPSLIANDNLSSVFELSDYEIQEGYIYTLNKSRLETMAKEEELLLQAEGYKYVDIVFSSSNMTNPELEIDLVNISLVNLVFDEEAEHKTIIEVKDFLTERMIEKYKVEKGEVIYEE